MREIEKKVVILFSWPRSRIIDLFSALISSMFFLIAFWIVIAGYVFFFDSNRGFFVVMGLAMVFILHFIISEGVLKVGGKRFSLERSRPYKAYPELIKPIGKKFQDSSFPSSHLASMVGGLVVLVFFYNFLWPMAIALTLILAWSRIRNGMHYPSDVLVGIVLGFIYGYLSLEMLQFLFY